MDINEDYKMTKAKSCYHCQPLVKENEELKQRLAEVEVKKTDLILLAKAAKDYINKSPCDPDIFPEQWEAYVVYKQLLEKTNEV